MSTLAIPPKRVRLYRVLWDRWIIVLRILFDLGAASHPVKWRAVADVLLVDKKTAQKYLAGLVRDGHLALAGEAYMLTEAGMDMLQEHEQGENFPLEGKNPGEKFSPLKEVVVVNESKLNLLTPPTPKLGKIPGENFSPLVKLVIEHIGVLFEGSQMVTQKLPEFSDEILLGWLAYAYDKRTSLNSPVGLVYSKLQRDERPPVEFMRNPTDYLPGAFLQLIGLQEASPEVEEDPDPTPVRELTEAERILQQLAERSIEISTVCITFTALSFENHVLRLGLPDETRRERWSRRLGDLINQQLRQLTEDDQARVEFVVAVETNE